MRALRHRGRLSAVVKKADVRLKQPSVWAGYYVQLGPNGV